MSNRGSLESLSVLKKLNGTIHYDQLYKELPAITNKARNDLPFADHDIFEIKKLQFETQANVLVFEFEGTASKGKSGTVARSTAHLLMAFDYITGRPHIMALLGIVLWMVPTILATWGLLKGAKR